MQTKATIEPPDSPVPGVIPEPVGVVTQPGLAASPRADGTPEAASPPGRRTRPSTMLATLLSVIRGDRYMVDANPPARRTKER